MKASKIAAKEIFNRYGGVREFIINFTNNHPSIAGYNGGHSHNGGIRWTGIPGTDNPGKIILNTGSCVPAVEAIAMSKNGAFAFLKDIRQEDGHLVAKVTDEHGRCHDQILGKYRPTEIIDDKHVRYVREVVLPNAFKLASLPSDWGRGPKNYKPVIRAPDVISLVAPDVIPLVKPKRPNVHNSRELVL